MLSTMIGTFRSAIIFSTLPLMFSIMLLIYLIIKHKKAGNLTRATMKNNIAIALLIGIAGFLTIAMNPMREFPLLSNGVCNYDYKYATESCDYSLDIVNFVIIAIILLIVPFIMKGRAIKSKVIELRKMKADNKRTKVISNKEILKGIVLYLVFYCLLIGIFAMINIVVAGVLHLKIVG